MQQYVRMRFDPRIVRWEGTVTITLLSSNATAACVQTPIDVITHDMLCTMDGPCFNGTHHGVIQVVP